LKSHDYHVIMEWLLLSMLHEDDPHSDLSIFKSRGTTVDVGRVYHLSEEDRNSDLLYMCTNLDEMTHYFL
jgi:hypothetical protein